MQLFSLNDIVRKLLSTQMRNGRNLAAAITTMFAIWLTPTPAHADPDYVTATFSNVNPGQVVTITNTVSPKLSESGWAGVYNFTNATSNIGLSGDLQTFCIDIAENINGGNRPTFGVAALSNAPVPGQAMGELRANLIAELWYLDYAKIAASKTQAEANSNAAAFQIAIWEIVNETRLDSNGKLVLSVTNDPLTTADTFYVTGNSTTLATANTWLSALDLTGNGPRTPGLIALTSDGYQDYVVQGPVTPAPPGLVLGLIGSCGAILPVVWRSWKRFLADATVAA